MAQEEQNQRCSNGSGGGGGGGAGSGSGGGGGGIIGGSSCGGRSSKKLKQKKVPQRGLGVAQLERIRLEEQKKKDAAIQAGALLSSNSVLSTTNLRHNPPPSLNPFHPHSLSSLSLPNSISRPVSSFPNTDFLRPNTVLLPNSCSSRGGGETGRPLNWGLYNLEGEKNHIMDYHGLGFGSNESDPIWPSHNLTQRTQQWQPRPSSSMVNVPSGSSSSSSAINCPQMEPPSNQSFYSNYFTPMWPEEDKTVGVKRPYPFTLGNAPLTSFPIKFSAIYVPPITRSEDSASNGNGGVVFAHEPINQFFRQGPLSSQLDLKKVAEETKDLNGDFLTLAPPTAALPHYTSNYKAPSIYPSTFCGEIVESGSPYQGSGDNPIHPPGPSRSTRQQPFYSFFPLARTPVRQESSSSSSCSEKVGENLDLNLKL